MVFADLPVAVFNGLAADTYTSTVQRFNDTETVGLGPIITQEIVLPQPEAPDPSVGKKIIITDYYNERSQVKFLLWATVPAALQSQFAVPGKASEWAFATVEENAAIAAGEVAELAGSMSRGVKSDGEVRAALDVRWERFNASVQDAEALNQENTYEVESGLWLKI